MSWAREQQIDVAFEVLERHVNRYDEDFVSKGKHPRDKDWLPVRFAVRDAILAQTDLIVHTSIIKNLELL